jgi:hypothetical protein
MKEKYKDYTMKVVEEKRKYARKMIGLPMYKDVSPKDRPEWHRKHLLFIEICEQILVCEQLMMPLTREMIDDLCKMETLNQIYNYVRRVKIA